MKFAGIFNVSGSESDELISVGGNVNNRFMCGKNQSSQFRPNLDADQSRSEPKNRRGRTEENYELGWI